MYVMDFEGIYDNKRVFLQAAPIVSVFFRRHLLTRVVFGRKDITPHGRETFLVSAAVFSVSELVRFSE